MTVQMYKQSGDTLISGQLDLQNKIFNKDMQSQISPEQFAYEEFKKSTPTSLTFYEWKKQSELK